MSGSDDTLASLGEDRLIEIFARPGGALGEKLIVPNGDDAAAWFFDSRYVSVITTDTLVEGTHFDLSYTNPRDVGRKLMAVNLSDVAAMGARSRYVLLSITLPSSTKIDVAESIAAGIQEACKAHGVAVIGGNTTRTQGPMVLTATLIGRTQPDEIARRRGTQLGDAIFVTGHLGDAKAGLHMVQTQGIPSAANPWRPLYEALTAPKARTNAGRELARTHLVHAMCDVSDGFSQDLRRLLVPEGLGARIDAAELPISTAMRSYSQEYGFSPERWALEGGEDYELLFTADPHDAPHITSLCASCGTPVSCVGTVTASTDLEAIMSDGSVQNLPMGFSHF